MIQRVITAIKILKTYTQGAYLFNNAVLPGTLTVPRRGPLTRIRVCACPRRVSHMLFGLVLFPGRGLQEDGGHGH